MAEARGWYNPMPESDAGYVLPRLLNAAAAARGMLLTAVFLWTGDNIRKVTTCTCGQVALCMRMLQKSICKLRGGCTGGPDATSPLPKW